MGVPKADLSWALLVAGAYRRLPLLESRGKFKARDKKILRGKEGCMTD